MTEPGYVAPPSPGWWVRTNRVGINSTGYNWAVTATGSRATQGTAAGTYNWAGASTGVSPVLLTFINANANNGTSVTIPTHAVGNIIVIASYNAGLATIPGKPTASGTVPAWVDIDAVNGANSNGMRTAEFVATATTTTSGIWANADFMIAAVISGQFSTPIGGHAEAGSTATGSATAPAVTLTNADNSSMLLHFLAQRVNTGFNAWDAPPAGYTQRAASVASTSGLVLITKNVVTSDGAVTNTNNGTATTGYRGATVEVRAH